MRKLLRKIINKIRRLYLKLYRGGIFYVTGPELLPPPLSLKSKAPLDIKAIRLHEVINAEDKASDRMRRIAVILFDIFILGSVSYVFIRIVYRIFLNYMLIKKVYI